MSKVFIFIFFCLLYINQAYADVKKEVEFLKNKDCKSFFLENKKTKKENEKYKDNKKFFIALQAYALSREAGAYNDCYKDFKKSIAISHQAISLILSIERPDENVLQQLATAYQLLGYDYNKSGDKKNGIKFLEMGLKIDEENFYEKNFKSIAETYNVLGFWYTDIYQYKVGENYQKKYLEYVKKIKGENSIDYYKSYLGLAQDYITSGKYESSVKIFLELEKKLSSFNLENIEKVLFYRSLSLSYYYNQDFELQRKYLLISFDILNKNKKQINKDKFTRYEILLNNDIALSYSYTYDLYGDTKNLDLAEKYLLKSIQLSKAINKDDELYINLGNLGLIYKSKGNMEKAIEVYTEAVDLCQKRFSKNHVECLKQKNGLGFIHYRNNDLKKATNIFLDAIKNEPQDFGAFLEFKISNRNLLGLVYQDLGNYELAEKYLLEAVSLWNPGKPQNHVAYFDTLNSLYNLYYTLGRFEESAKGYQELLILMEKKYGAQSPQLITALNGLSLIYSRKGSYQEAVDTITRAINIIESKSSTHPLKGTLYHNLAYAYSAMNNLQLAEKNYEIALKLKIGGKGYNDVTSLTELAKNKIYLKKYDEAKTLLDKSISVIDNRLGSNHPIKAYVYERYTELYYSTKNIDSYIKNLAEAHNLISLHANGIFGEQYSVKKNFFTEPIDLFFDTLDLYSEQQFKYIEANFKKHSNVALQDAILELSEISRTTTINESVKNLIERNKDPKVATLKKDYQNLIIDYEKANKYSDNDVEKIAIFKNLSNLKDKIFEKKQTILKAIRVNEKQAFTNQLTVSKIQSQLHQDEVLISYYFTPNRLHVAIINNKNIQFKTIQTNNEKINRIIKKIRASLVVKSNDKISDFNVLQSRILYNEILNPIKKSIENKKNLIIVPHQSLLSLPFEILIDEEGLEKNIDYKKIKWLINKFNISYYPSINSFYFLRTLQFKKTPKDFAGFGDPKFTMVAEAEEDIKFNNLFLRSGIANKKELLKFNELPETRNELIFLSKIFKNGSDLYLGGDFSEKKVKALKLDQYRVISFATHAVLANEVNNIAEPGIILTPPETPNENDDGILTVSEIQRLKMNADTVILSACNTAGKDGGANAEGLSGLASAFFHAGSKSLMVTHWSVETNSAVNIIMNTFKNFENKNSLSSSLTLAKREMIKNNNYSHPLFWAPFVIIGDNFYSKNKIN